MLLGYNPWGHKESNTTERLSPAQHTTPLAAFWIGPEIAIMSEVSPKEKGKYHMVSFIGRIQNMTQMNLCTK